MPLQKKKQNIISKTVGFFNPRSLKGGIALFALVFAIGGGVYFLYRSFAATSGGYHNCEVEVSTQQLYCWGSNSYGQIGMGDKGTANYKSPRWLANNVLLDLGSSTPKFQATPTAPSAGNEFSCTVGLNEWIYCWGRNHRGQLGLGGTNEYKSAAKDITGYNGVDKYSSVEAGNEYACAIKKGTPNTLWCWGANDSGQLGNGTKDDKYTATKVQGNWNGTIASVSAGEAHTCALININVDPFTKGQLWCWGNNQYKQTLSNVASTTPTRANTENSYLAVSAGRNHTCAIRSDETLWCWGANESGQSGTAPSSPLTTPVRVGGTKKFVRVSAGAKHSCAIEKTTLNVYCWGTGQLGGKTVATGTPTQVLRQASDGALSAFTATQINTGIDHTCARTKKPYPDGTTKGEVVCWGKNNLGQLGIVLSSGSYPTERIYPKEAVLKADFVNGRRVNLNWSSEATL